MSAADIKVWVRREDIDRAWARTAGGDGCEPGHGHGSDDGRRCNHVRLPGCPECTCPVGVALARSLRWLGECDLWDVEGGEGCETATLVVNGRDEDGAWQTVHVDLGDEASRMIEIFDRQARSEIDDLVREAPILLELERAQVERARALVAAELGL